MNYNKKQMEPIINKLQIDPETNPLFRNIIEMFNEQPNYQLWGVKMAFNHHVPLGTIQSIHDWVENNKQSVKTLAKQNVVSYNSGNAIRELLKEMKGVDIINGLRDAISHFNTAQRKLLTVNIFPKAITPIEAYGNDRLQSLYKMYTSFKKISANRRIKFFSNCSSFTNADEIIKAMYDCIADTYIWEKEDMLSYMENNCPNCELIYNNGPFVIIRVPDYASSKKLCGNGRTQWCITKESSYFKDYCDRSKERIQYFYFDFSRKESDAFAHIGFTVEKGRGIIFAQTCDNCDMLKGYQQGDETMNIYGALSKAGAQLSLFLRITKNAGFEWSHGALLNLIKDSPTYYALAMDKNNMVILNVIDVRGIDKLISHTYISRDKIVNTDGKCYVFCNFNLEYTDDNSIITLTYTPDRYGSYSLKDSVNIFNLAVDWNAMMKELGISQDDYFMCEKLDARILLHKLIDEKREAEAMALIGQMGDDFDVNYEFKEQTPIFSAIANDMDALFAKIVGHPKFNSSTDDGCGETLLQSLMYMYASNEIDKSKDESERLKRMIEAILTNPHIDINAVDINLDSAIYTACEYPELLWVLKRLIYRPDVNIGLINDIDNTIVGVCLYYENFDALSIVGQRPDIVLTKTDKEVARQKGIELSEYLKPNPHFFDTAQAQGDEVLVAAIAK